MAFLTRHFGVLPRQRETAFRMAFTGKSRFLESRGRMASVASVAIRIRGEYSSVRIGMTNGTRDRVGFMPCLPVISLVAFLAGKGCVFPFKREGGTPVRFGVKERRLETRRAVAHGTIHPTGRRRIKCPSVWIVMAVSTEIMFDLGPEIALLMARVAAQVRVFSDQAKPGEAMVEILSRAIRLPSPRTVTRIALFVELQNLECASMRIRVTAPAAVEGNSFEEKFSFRAARRSPVLNLNAIIATRVGALMTFFTWNLMMAPFERESRAGVVKSRSRPPGFGGMAFEAVVAKLFFVRIPVAEITLAAKSEKRLVEVFHLDLRAGSVIDLRFIVAASALLVAMPPFQSESGLLTMIEGSPVQWNEGKFSAAVFFVTDSAITAGALVSPRVKPCIRLHPSLDLIVAFQAF